jgi:hypothetical protein
MLFIGAWLVGAYVFCRWLRDNKEGSWWIWRLTYWSKGITGSYRYRTLEGNEEQRPTISIRIALVNPSIFTVVIVDTLLSLKKLGSTNNYKLSPWAIMEDFNPSSLMRNDANRTITTKESFRPILLKPRSEEICEIAFVSMEKSDEFYAGGYEKLVDLLPVGKYDAALEFTKASRKPIRINFCFDLKPEVYSHWLADDGHLCDKMCIIFSIDHEHIKSANLCIDPPHLGEMR